MKQAFLYVRSPFESRKEEEDFKIKEIERVAKEKKHRFKYLSC
ncbi:hypothetical protein RCO48_09290 [Peribacillus frigoritolerans]|nr:hypothetical protein [Peribacillus frigoritolerans]